MFEGGLMHQTAIPLQVFYDVLVCFLLSWEEYDVLICVYMYILQLQMLSINFRTHL